MPISSKGKKILLKNLPQLKTGTIFELGSGWGGLALSLAKKYPNHTVYGIERSTIPWFIAKLRQKFSFTPNLHFQKKDFYKMSLNESCLIVCYLFPGAMIKLEEKFSLELQSAKVISYVFSLPKTHPERVLEVDDIYSSKIFFYRF